MKTLKSYVCQNLKGMDGPSLGRPDYFYRRALLMSQPYGDYLTAKHEKVVLANPRKFIYI